jgi:hypothetical protein
MKKRSKYRPKRVLQSPMDFVLSGFKPVRDLEGVYLDAQLKNRAALEQLRLGSAVKDNINILIGVVNITEALALDGIGIEWLPEIKEGQDALLALSRRGVARGMRFIMTAKEWETLKLMMDLHEEQLALATVHDIEKACDYVCKVVAQGKARAVVPTRKEEV